MKNRCLLVDDEPLAIKLLEQHVARIGTLEVVATASNALRAIELLHTQQAAGQPIDLLFCDIKMPQLSGLDLLKLLTNPPRTILTTAYRDFALDGYDLDVVDYLLKPITFERFVRAVDRYHRLVHPPVESHNNRPAGTVPGNDQTTYLTLKSGPKTYRIDPAEVLYLESQKDYVKVVLPTQAIRAKATLSELAGTLSETQFLRIHRSFLVNLRYVRAFTAITLDVGTLTLPIGAFYRDSVLARLNDPTTLQSH